RPADRRRRIRHLAVTRPPLQPGPVRSAVRRGDRLRPGTGRRSRRGNAWPNGAAIRHPPARSGLDLLDPAPIMISATPHARSREDRAGDPLDGLVNLFDLGIVLAVAFLLAALSSLHLSGALT